MSTPPRVRRRGGSRRACGGPATALVVVLGLGGCSGAGGGTGGGAGQEHDPGRAVLVDCAAAPGGDGSPARPLRSTSEVSGPASGPTPPAAVRLRRGCTFGAGLAVPASWSGVAVEAYGDGPAPRLSGTGLPRDRAVLDVAAPGARVRDLEVLDAAGPGVAIGGAGARVERIRVTRAAYGVRITAPHVEVSASEIQDLHMDVLTPGGVDDVGAIGFEVLADDVTVRGNTCRNCRAVSHDFGLDGGFVEVFNHGDRLQVLDNTVVSGEGLLEIGANQADSSARDIVVRGNTVTDGHGGVWVHHDGPFRIGSVSLTLERNVLENTSTGKPVLGGGASTTRLIDNEVTTVATVSDSGSPADHRDNHYRLLGGASVGFPLDDTERVTRE